MKKGLKVSSILLLSIICVVIISFFTTRFYMKVLSPQNAFGNDRIVDKIDLPFVDDPEVIGNWQSIDFVTNIQDFEAGKKKWKGELFLKKLVFKEKGELLVDDDSPRPWFAWTKGIVTHKGDKTASKYIVKEISGSKYMFYEWKSGDYIIRHMTPEYYVLKKVE